VTRVFAPCALMLLGVGVLLVVAAQDIAATAGDELIRIVLQKGWGF